MRERAGEMLVEVQMRSSSERGGGAVRAADTGAFAGNERVPGDVGRCGITLTASPRRLVVAEERAGNVKMHSDKICFCRHTRWYE